MRTLIPLLAVLSLLPAGGRAEGLAGRRPNILLLVTDDQGFGDVSANGNPALKTPALDRLHAEGVRFTDFHVSPTCAPTRSALFTGRHEFKNGVTHTILERERLTLKATTLAQVLQSAGYTTGIFGKWHLGDEDAYQPGCRGFDEVFIHGAGGIGQTYPGSCGDAPGNSYFDPYILHNGTFEKTRGYCTDVFYRQATRWIDAKRQEGKPFFAYIPTNAPHAPLDVRPEDAALYEGKGLPPNAVKFFGMIHNIDQNIGTLLDRLDEWGLAKDTLVVFINDNGGTAGVQVYNAGMRGAKGSAWLGGTRASSFWRWPGTLRPADCDALTAHIDVFPTFAELAGVTLSDELKSQVEGRSLAPLLENPKAPWPDRVLFSHVGRWPKGTNPDEWKFRMAAARNKRWSLVSPDGGREPKWQLFDLEHDYGQQTNVIAAHPDVAKDLAAAYDRWWSECRPLMVNEDAEPPALNPFQERFYKQFGGQPTPEDLRKMDMKQFLEGRPNAAAPKARRPSRRAAPPTAAMIGPAVAEPGGVLAHEVRSPFQPGATRIRVLLPDRQPSDAGRLPVVYVLPVEAGDGHRYGDGLAEARSLDLANRHRTIVVAPTFAQLPWYADHPTDPAIRQERHLLEVVLPFVESRYPARRDAGGRLLLGFSKSGWGAWSLLLRHPETFGRAAAWDAPLMLDAPGAYGSGPIFGTPENFRAYELARLVRDRAATLGGEPRLILTGYGNFREHHRRMHALLESLGVPHADRDGPAREHAWGGGWIDEAVGLLFEPNPSEGDRR